MSDRFRDRQREATRQIGALAALIHREWWRPLRNRRRRQELWAIYDEAERDYAEHVKRAGKRKTRIPPGSAIQHRQ
jgi:hypothetical protein